MQLRSFCKSKIHRATVTHTDVDYIDRNRFAGDLVDNRWPTGSPLEMGEPAVEV